jgi:hypothetical protein
MSDQDTDQIQWNSQPAATEDQIQWHNKPDTSQLKPKGAATTAPEVIQWHTKPDTSKLDQASNITDPETQGAVARNQQHPVEGAEFHAAPSTWQSFTHAVAHPIDYLGEVEEDTQKGGGRTIVGRTLGHMQHGSMSDNGYTADQSGVAPLIAGPIQGPPKVARGGLRMLKAMVTPPDEEGKNAKEGAGAANELIGGALQTPGAALLASPEALTRAIPAVAASTYAQKGLKYIGLPDEYAELGGNVAGLAGGMAVEDPALSVRAAAKTADVLAGKPMRAGLKKILPTSAAPAIEENVHAPFQKTGLTPSEKLMHTLDSDVDVAREQLRVAEKKVQAEPNLIRSNEIPTRSINPKPEDVKAYNKAKANFTESTERAAAARENAQWERADKAQTSTYPIQIEAEFKEGQQPVAHQTSPIGTPVGPIGRTIEPVGGSIERPIDFPLNRSSEYTRHSPSGKVSAEDIEAQARLFYGKPDNMPRILTPEEAGHPTSMPEARSASGEVIPREQANVISSKPQSTKGAKALGKIRLPEAAQPAGFGRIGKVRPVEAPTELIPEAPKAESKVYDLSKPLDKPVGLRKEGAELSPEALEAQPVVRQKVAELGNDELKQLARAHGLHPDDPEYAFGKGVKRTEATATSSGRKQGGREALIEAIVNTVDSPEMENLGRSADGLKDNPAMAGKAIKDRAKSIFPRLHGDVDELGNPTGYGAKNTGVTREDYNASRKRSQQKTGGTLGMMGGNVPLDEWVTQAKFHFEAGARSFADFSAKMLADAGEAIRPYLENLYARAQGATPEAAERSAAKMRAGREGTPHGPFQTSEPNALIPTEGTSTAPALKGRSTLIPEHIGRAEEVKPTSGPSRVSPETYEEEQNFIRRQQGKQGHEWTAQDEANSIGTTTEPVAMSFGKPKPAITRPLIPSLEGDELIAKYGQGNPESQSRYEQHRMVDKMEEGLLRDRKARHVPSQIPVPEPNPMERYTDPNSVHYGKVKQILSDRGKGVSSGELENEAQNVMQKYLEQVAKGNFSKDAPPALVMERLKTIAERTRADWFKKVSGLTETGEPRNVIENKRTSESKGIINAPTDRSVGGADVDTEHETGEPDLISKQEPSYNEGMTAEGEGNARLAEYLKGRPKTAEVDSKLFKAANDAREAKGQAAYDKAYASELKRTTNTKYPEGDIDKADVAGNYASKKVLDKARNKATDELGKHFGLDSDELAAVIKDSGRSKAEAVKSLSKMVEVYNRRPAGSPTSPAAYTGLNRDYSVTKGPSGFGKIIPKEEAPTVAKPTETYGDPDKIYQFDKSTASPLRQGRYESDPRYKDILGAGQTAKGGTVEIAKRNVADAEKLLREAKTPAEQRQAKVALTKAQVKLNNYGLPRISGGAPDEQWNDVTHTGAGNLEPKPAPRKIAEPWNDVTVEPPTSEKQGKDVSDVASKYLRELDEQGFHNTNVENLVSRDPSMGRVVEGVQDIAKQYMQQHGMKPIHAELIGDAGSGTKATRPSGIGSVMGTSQYTGPSGGDLIPESDLDVESKRILAKHEGEANRAARAPEEAKYDQLQKIRNRLGLKPTQSRSGAPETLGEQQPLTSGPEVERLKARATAKYDYAEKQGSNGVKHEVTATDPKGNMLSVVSAVEDKPGVWTVRGSTNAGRPGLETGYEAYSKLLRQSEAKANATGKPITVRSDPDMLSESAAQTWKKLARREFKGITWKGEGNAARASVTFEPRKPVASVGLPKSLGGAEAEDTGFMSAMRRINK